MIKSPDTIKRFSDRIVIFAPWPISCWIFSVHTPFGAGLIMISEPAGKGEGGIRLFSHIDASVHNPSPLNIYVDELLQLKGSELHVRW